MNPPLPRKPFLAELRDWLAETAARCRRRHDFRASALVSVAQDIAADAIAQNQRLAVAAHRAETLDREAATRLDSVLADGAVTPDETSIIREALRFVQRSAELDHDLSEQAAVS